MNSSSNIKEKVYKFFSSFFSNDSKPDSIIEPLTCLIRLAILEYKPVGTKISVNNNKIEYNDPNILQGAIRWSNGDAREDLHNIFNPIKKAVEWFDKDQEEIAHIFACSIKGLYRLKKSYHHNSVISHSIQYYIDYIDNNLKNEKHETKDKMTSETNTLYLKLKEFWTPREIVIINNLLSCFVVTEALIQNESAEGTMIVLNDHEEIGSVSTSGADGPFLESVLRRATVEADFERVRVNSLMVSIDNAHGVHPNYASKHDEGHRPLLNEGPVVKVNANHRYATTAITQGIIEQAAERADVPLQYFSSRADLGCGSTIGPLTAGRLGIDTIDLGCAQFAMHSAREPCGTKDPELMLKLLTQLTQRDLI